jgi:hypothetical protein
MGKEKIVCQAAAILTHRKLLPQTRQKPLK